jgi:hypothetical protein
MTVMRCDVFMCNVRKEMNMGSSVREFKRVYWLIMGLLCGLQTLNHKWHSKINMGEGKLQNKCH